MRRLVKVGALAAATAGMLAMGVPPAGAVENTPPTIELANAVDGAEYEWGFVYPVCQAYDAEDLPPGFWESFLPTLSSSVSGNSKTVTVACTWTDSGGLSTTQHFSYTEVDTRAPVPFDPDDFSAQDPQPVRTPEANAAGWNTGPVTVEWGCADFSGSGFTTIPYWWAAVSTVVDTEGADQSAAAGCTDVAGNTLALNEPGINIDSTAPTIGAAVLTPAANGAGWHNSPVSVTWDCTDEVSGPVTAQLSADLPDEGADQSVTSPPCADRAGNDAGTATESGVDIDLTAPSVAWVNPIADGAEFGYGQVPAAPTCTAGDELSGPAGCTVTGYAATAGPHTLVATATDRAGNTTSSDPIGYTVIPWTLTGFATPVDADPGVWNVVKGGSTVPLKFEVFDRAVELSTPAAIGATFSVTPVACPGASADLEPVAFTTTGETSLRYDTSSGQFVQNWRTPKRAGTCQKVTMTTADGSALHAKFQLK